MDVEQAGRKAMLVEGPGREQKTRQGKTVLASYLPRGFARLSEWWSGPEWEAQG